MSETANTIANGTSVETVEYKNATAISPLASQPESTGPIVPENDIEILRFDKAPASTVTIQYDPAHAQRRAVFRRITRRFIR